MCVRVMRVGRNFAPSHMCEGVEKGSAGSACGMYSGVWQRLRCAEPFVHEVRQRFGRFGTHQKSPSDDVWKRGARSTSLMR